jgi:enoyl reductase
MRANPLRRAALAAAALIPLPVLLGSPGPAHAAAPDPGRAGSGATRPPGVTGEGFQRGRTAGVQLTNSRIRLSGDGLRRGRSDGYRLRRPCWYEPSKTPEEMLKTQEALRHYWFHHTPGATEEKWQRFLDRFRERIGQDGMWWQPAYNHLDPDALACRSKLEAFLFVPNGTVPQGGVTVRELVDVARAALTVPEPRVRLSPRTRSYVNLPTWVWLTDPGGATRSVTATLPGVMSATVTATRTRIEIDPGTTRDRAEVRDGCGGTGRPYTKGGEFTCGVRYLRASADRPRGVYELTVTTLWQVNVTATRPVGPIGYAPVRASATVDVPVGEVQSTVTGGAS